MLFLFCVSLWQAKVIVIINYIHNLKTENVSLPGYMDVFHNLELQ